MTPDKQAVARDLLTLNELLVEHAPLGSEADETPKGQRP